MSKKLELNVRKQQILEAAVELAKSKGYLHIQRVDVATLARCSEASVTLRFGTMHKLKHNVIRYAVKNNVLPIIAQGIVANDQHVKKKVNHEVKKQALATLL